MMKQVSSLSELLKELSTMELAQALANRLAIAPQDWHRLKGNRQAQAAQQVAAALVFLLKQQPGEALPRLQQAVGWLDHSIAIPGCPDRHGRDLPLTDDEDDDTDE